jgi:transposase
MSFSILTQSQAVERAFRVIKGTLEIRPMSHFTPRRIEALVMYLLCGIKIYKEFESMLWANGINLSVDEVFEIVK